MKTKLDLQRFGAGPVRILALHASGTGAGSLARFANALGNEVEVILPNLHGYGSSAHSVDDQNPLQQHLEIALAALNALEGAPVHLFGHSMGGVVALMLATRFPRAFTSIHLAEPVAFGVLDRKADADVIAEDRQSIEGFASGGHSGLAQFIEYWNGTSWRSMPAAVRQSLENMSQQIAREALCVSADATPADHYREIRSPVQVLVGDRTNPVAERICTRLSEHHPHWTVSRVENAGHMLPIEQPEQVAAFVASGLVQ